MPLGLTSSAPMPELRQLIGRATQLHQSKRYFEAEALYLQALQFYPDNYPALHLLGLLQLQQNNIANAITLMERALKAQPRSPETLANYAMALKAAGRYQEALEIIDQEATVRPVSARSLNNRGTVLVKLKRLDEAIQSFEAAAVLETNNAEILTNLALAQQELGQLERALELLTKVVELRPRSVEAWNNRGNCRRAMNAQAAALADFNQALALAPGNAGVLLNEANTLVLLGALDEALASYDMLLKAHPNLVAALVARAKVLEQKGDFKSAITDLEAARRASPDYPYLAGRLLHLKTAISDWDDFPARKNAVDAATRAGRRAVEPFLYNGISDSLADLQSCSRVFTADHYPATASRGPRQQRKPGPIRIGYLAGEFHNHATMLLGIGLFERYDRGQFEIYAFDNGGSDGSPMRARFEAAASNIEPIASLSDIDAAKRITDAGIDILVNLNGHVGRHRTGVFAQRPAAIQVSYLGFPGTLGAPYMDYILADAHLIAENETQFFDEKVVWLPNSYQINDDRRALPGAAERNAHGLPENAFVYCQFNASYKVGPELFAIWMRILTQSQDSVLWLLADNELSVANMRKAAAMHGVDSARLIFAPRLAHHDHMARLQLADLLLDTLPCSAHTVASEALWAGLPVLTCRSKTFAGRVGASLLEAIGLPELVAEDWPDYEKKALALARGSDLTREIRARLAKNRKEFPLFDTAQSVRHIEAAYKTMFSRHQAGLPPECFRASVS